MIVLDLFSGSIIFSDCSIFKPFNINIFLIEIGQGEKVPTGQNVK